MTTEPTGRRSGGALLFLLGFAAALAVIMGSGWITAHLASRESGPVLPPRLIPDRFVTGPYTVAVRSIEAPADPGNGGTMAAIGEDVFIVTRHGAFHRLSDDRERFDALDIAPPVEVEPMMAFFDTDEDKLTLGYRDLLLRKKGDVVEFTLSHQVIDPSVPCVAVAISQAVIPLDELQPGRRADPDWRRIWTSQPCLDNPPGTYPLQTGGAMARDASGMLLIFVGDFGFDGYARSRVGIGSQAEGSDYGKVLAIDEETGQSRIVSSGNRNPGGIVFAGDGSLWLAENGPRGGDELNLIVDGHDYGWPTETYGVDYAHPEWPMDPTPDDHRRFAKPVYAWVPSIAPADVVEYQGAEFPLWQGDLLVAALRDKSVRRLKIREGRVIYDQPLMFGERIRHLAIDSRGRIFVKPNKHDLKPQEVLELTQEVSSSGSMAGLRDQLTICADCHKLEDGDGGDFAGPSLVGVFGRDIASVDGYLYSEALLELEGVWTFDRLTAYISSPQSVAKGTSMPRPDLDATGLARTVLALRDLEKAE